MTAIDIAQAVAQDYGVTVADLIGRRRTARLCEPRHVAIWLARDLLELSFPALARAFARDPSTVQHAVHRACALLDSPVVQHRIDRIRRSLVGSTAHLEARIRRLDAARDRAAEEAAALRVVLARMREAS